MGGATGYTMNLQGLYLAGECLGCERKVRLVKLVAGSEVEMAGICG